MINWQTIGRCIHCGAELQENWETGAIRWTIDNNCLHWIPHCPECQNTALNQIIDINDNLIFICRDCDLMFKKNGELLN